MQEMPPALTTAIASVGSAAITLLISLYVRDNARKVVEEALIKVQLDFKREIKSELTLFKDEFLHSMDATYRRSAECTLMMEQAEDFQDILAKRADSQEASLKDLHNQVRRYPHNGDALMSDPVLISLIATLGAFVTSTVSATLSYLNNKKVNVIDKNMANLEKNTNNKMDLLLQAKDELRDSTNKSADAEGFKRGSEAKG